MENITGGIQVRDEVTVRASRYMTGVYVQMMLGILVTALIAYALMVSGMMYQLAVNGGQGLVWGIFILQLGSLFMFRPLAQRAAPGAVKALFFFYSAITGVTMGYIGLAYSAASIVNVFGATSLAFGGLAMYGYMTKRDLGPIGTFLFLALFMTFGLSLFYAVASSFGALAAYMPSLNITLGILGVVVFSGLTAYESQKLRTVALELAKSDASEATISRYTSQGALMMYLNFINLFISLLRLTGGRRR